MPIWSTRHFHLSTSDTPGRFRHGFVVSAGGKTLKTREFDVEPSPDRGGLVLSCEEGSLTAHSFALKPDEDDLVKFHPGLLTASSAVIHRFGVDPAYAEWRSHVTIALPSPHSRSDRHLGGIITGGRIVTLPAERAAALRPGPDRRPAGRGPGRDGRAAARLWSEGGSIA